MALSTNISVGDLVEFKPVKLTGMALTAVKYYERMKKNVGCNKGFVLEEHETHCMVMFDTASILIPKVYLNIISKAEFPGCSVCECDPCDCDWGNCE